MDKEKTASPAESSTDLVAAEFYIRSIRIGLLFGFLNQWWRKGSFSLPGDPERDFPQDREDPRTIPIDLTGIFKTPDAALLKVCILSFLQDAVDENNILDKSKAAQALYNFKQALQFVSLLPSDPFRPFDMLPGDSVSNEEKAVTYYLATRPETSADQWEFRSFADGKPVFSSPEDLTTNGKKLLVDSRSLTPEAQKLKTIYENLVAFYDEKTDGGKKKSSPNYFLDFIRQEIEGGALPPNLPPLENFSANDLLQVYVKPTTLVNFPLDKINSNVWNMLELTPHNQLKFAMEPSGSSVQATALFSIDFDQLDPTLTISKKLNAFDERCYIAVAALFNNGNEIMTASQICTLMGLGKRPSSAQIQKVNDSLTKMGAARVRIDNSHEASVLQSRPRFVYDSSLLLFERITAQFSNQRTESAIRVFREPALVTFARSRKQITTIPRIVFESPVNKNLTNMAIENYLIEAISHIKSGRRNPKILFSTVFERCHIAEKKQQQRAKKEYIPRLMDHYKETGFIVSFSISNDSVTVKAEISPPKAPSRRKKKKQPDGQNSLP